MLWLVRGHQIFILLAAFNTQDVFMQNYSYEVGKKIAVEESSGGHPTDETRLQHSTIVVMFQYLPHSPSYFPLC